MGIQIFQYSESHLEGIRSILTEYMTFLANEMIKPPWKYNIEVENGGTENTVGWFLDSQGNLTSLNTPGRFVNSYSWINDDFVRQKCPRGFLEALNN